MKLLRVFLCLAGAIVIALVSAAPVAEAQLECGDKIWEDTTLTEDLDCTGYDVGLIIPSPEWGVENITLDLGGYTISGGEAGGEEGLGVIAFHTVGTTIKNGTIKGFGIGVAGRGAHDLELKNLLFTDQTGNGFMAGSRPGFFRTEGVVIKDSIFRGQGNAGVGFFGAKGVEIKDSTFIGGENPAIYAIRFGDSDDVSIKNVDATRCYECVSAWGENNDVEIKDSTFHDIGLAMLVSINSGLKISGNHIGGECVELWDCGGMEIGPAGGDPVSGIKITNNFVNHEGDWGIVAYGNIVESEISSNHVYNYGDLGIGIFDHSTGNKITSNITFGNGTDLMHDESSSPNIWEDNGYQTYQGSDIPPPPPPSPLACGTVITEDTKLTGDLYCPVLDPPPVPGMRAALYILADGVTLDLGGHTITGPEDIGAGVWAPSTEGVTIKNGKLTGFRIGVEGRLARDLELKNLLLTGQRAGLRFGDAVGVTVKDSSFMGGENPVTSAIRFGDSEDVSIKNIDASHCYTGVGASESNNVEIKDSTFHDIVDGISFFDVSGIKISGNHTSDCPDEDCGDGIVLEGGTDISIKNNFVHNVYEAIHLFNVDDSVISNNHVYNNLESGIVLWDGSTGNRVTSNITFGTGDGVYDFDLEHDCSSIDNIWEDNSYVFCKGLEINGCTNPCN